VPGSFPIFLRRPSITLRPDKGAGLVSFFNFPRLDRSSEKSRAIPRVFDTRSFSADLVGWVPSVEWMGLFSATVRDRYKGW
jgi:hypothetical protein